MSFQILQLAIDEQDRYVNLREQVRGIMAEERGLELLLNAIVAVGGEFTRDDIERWVQETWNYSSDNRNTVAFCHGPERLIAMPDPAEQLANIGGQFQFASFSSE